jgi:hypothetical protein
MQTFLIELTLDVDEDATEAGLTTMDVASIFGEFDPGCGVLTVENITEVS